MELLGHNIIISVQVQNIFETLEFDKRNIVPIFNPSATAYIGTIVCKMVSITKLPVSGFQCCFSNLILSTQKKVYMFKFGHQMFKNAI